MKAARRFFNYLQNHPIWIIFTALIAILGAAQMILGWGTQINIDPGITYNETDPLGQRFTITNAGLLPIKDVHTVCTVTQVTTTERKSLPRFSLYDTVMVPRTRHDRILRRGGRTSSDCDFNADFGPKIERIDVSITVFYKSLSWPVALHTEGDHFSARRDASGKFLWAVAAGNPGPLEGDWDQTRTVLVQAYLPIQPANKEMISPEAAFDDSKLVLRGVRSRYPRAKVLIGTIN